MFPKIRETKRRGINRLFWDIYFGNEYLVALNKNSIPVEDIYNKNIFKYDNRNKKKLAMPVQLDLFSYQEDQEPVVNESINYLQVCNACIL